MTTIPPPASGEQLSAAAPDRDTLLVEYEIANAMVMHYDNFKWSAGSFVIAGVLIFWGALFSRDSPEALMGPGTIIAALIMGAWLLYAGHYRQLYLLKLHRIWEIERLLGMVANLRFARDGTEAPVYRPYGLRGHTIDALLFSCVGLGGPWLAAVRQGPQWWQLIPVLFVIGVNVVVFLQERRLKAHVVAGHCRCSRRLVFLTMVKHLAHTAFLTVGSVPLRNNSLLPTHKHAAQNLAPSRRARDCTGSG